MRLTPYSKRSCSAQLESRGSGWIPDSTLYAATPGFKTLSDVSEFRTDDFEQHLAMRRTSECPEAACKNSCELKKQDKKERKDNGLHKRILDPA